MRIEKIILKQDEIDPMDVSRIEQSLKTVADLCELSRTWAQSKSEHNDLLFDLQITLAPPVDRYADWMMVLKALGIE